MKNIKNIAFATLITLFAISCKEEAVKKTKEQTVASTEVAAENLETANFTIEGMTCEIGCAKLIEGKLTGVDGVTDAKVSFETKVAVVKFDKTKQSVASLTKTIEKVGGGDLYKVVK